jgi:hypothetical protein
MSHAPDMATVLHAAGEYALARDAVWNDPAYREHARTIDRYVSVCGHQRAALEAEIRELREALTTRWVPG